jgi:adenine-specific DNA-methyltransferase
MDEVFGEENSIVTIKFSKTSALGSELLEDTCDYILWYVKNKNSIKYRPLYKQKTIGNVGASKYKREMVFPGLYCSPPGEVSATCLNPFPQLDRIQFPL